MLEVMIHRHTGQLPAVRGPTWEYDWDPRDVAGKSLRQPAANPGGGSVLVVMARAVGG